MKAENEGNIQIRGKLCPSALHRMRTFLELRNNRNSGVAMTTFLRREEFLQLRIISGVKAEGKLITKLLDKTVNEITKGKQRPS